MAREEEREKNADDRLAAFNVAGKGHQIMTLYAAAFPSQTNPIQMNGIFVFRQIDESIPLIIAALLGVRAFVL